MVNDGVFVELGDLCDEVVEINVCELVLDLLVWRVPGLPVHARGDAREPAEDAVEVPLGEACLFCEHLEVRHGLGGLVNELAGLADDRVVRVVERQHGFAALAGAEAGLLCLGEGVEEDDVLLAG